MNRIMTGLVITLLLASGCAARVTTVIRDSAGEPIYTIVSKSDALVEYSVGDMKVVVDNRGRPGMMEQALGIMFMSLPDVDLQAR